MIPSSWALAERYLFDQLNIAASEFIENFMPIMTGCIMVRVIYICIFLDLMQVHQPAFNFAKMYIVEDEQTKNYDKQLKLIRSPIPSNREPRFVFTTEDWSIHRDILDDYLAPYEDIPDVDFIGGKCAWLNDEIYTNIIKLMNERMTRGDMPLNLNATCLVIQAFLYSGEEKYLHYGY
ncbi:hypothetical protein I4U23_016649 [Adineta vaga]|nr:hypothetical protein I4U23_016649 [Adineta vaga]